jgi:acetyl-CoA carboxylase carboxyltransferase component
VRWTAAGRQPGVTEVLAPMQGTVVGVAVVGDPVTPGKAVVVIESMKIECPVELDISGTVSSVRVTVGALVKEGDVLVVVEESSGAETAHGAVSPAAGATTGAAVRADLAEVADRHARLLDTARPEAVEQRRRTGQRTARENIDDLCDPDSFLEYGGLVVAAQRQRRPIDELIEKTPADGIVGGVGTVDGRRTVVMAYDYTVLAGTQGMQSHRKKDRLYELAERERLPVVLFGEGGGGRPGDTDGLVMTGLDVPTFHTLGRLSGKVPLVAIVSGFCFAGNAALVGCCDVIIATAGSNIGMGGPAMIEGGGLGVFAPDEVGPLDVQTANGVVDIAVADEAEAVAVTRRYLSYFTGRAGVEERGHADQTVLRSLIPEDRTRIYDVRRVLDTVADTGSVLELRRAFGPTMLTALARVDGHPLGIVANNPAHLGGAIDAVGADKAARFLQLCDAFGLPVLFFCDTPGIMVGPDAERTALVRHVSRLFVVGANLSVPTATIILRKGYGLGSMTMAGGGFKAGLFCVAWPTGEIGGMGLEGAIRLGYRKELAAIADPDERERTFDKLVGRLYEQGKALAAATTFELDDVIDPADSRRWITSLLTASPGPVDRDRRTRFIDPW